MINSCKKFFQWLLIILFTYLSIINPGYAQSPCPRDRCERIDPPIYCTECQKPRPIPECLPVCAKRQPPTGVEMIIDGLVIRPISFAAIFVGAAVYLVTLPFSAMSGSWKQTSQALIGDPINFTFNRRLGDIPINNEY